MQIRSTHWGSRFSPGRHLVDIFEIWTSQHKFLYFLTIKFLCLIFTIYDSISQKSVPDAFLGWTRTPNGMVSRVFWALDHILTRCSLVCGSLFWKKVSKFGKFLEISKVFSMVSLNITKGGLYLQNQFRAEPRPPMDWSDLEFEPLIMV